MSKYRRIAVLIIIAELLVCVAFNVAFCVRTGDRGRTYRVEAGRVARELRTKAPEEIDLSGYGTIVKVSEFHAEEPCSRDYVVEEVDGVLYRIEYVAEESRFVLAGVNLAFLFMLLCSAALLLYVGRYIIRPFQRMSHYSEELARGNLTAPVRAEKNKFFGGFLWGLDMLRENLEEKKQREFELQREKKTLILSLSHDIKTPLSAIELYTRALAEGLYDSEEKRREALLGIVGNAEEIKRYVNEITQASREDFLNLEVRVQEFYLADVMRQVERYYKDKLSVIHTEFTVEPFENCLLAGDADRVVEVLQNLMENAVKYGDGAHIGISFDEEEDCRLIRVENSGSSLQPDELGHLFDSFYRGSNSANVRGSGLGLYICRSLMRRMGGEVYAELDGGRFIATVVVRKA